MGVALTSPAGEVVDSRCLEVAVVGGRYLVVVEVGMSCSLAAEEEVVGSRPLGAATGVEAEAHPLPHACVGAGGDVLLYGSRDSRDSLADGLFQAPISACRSRNCQRRMWGLLHILSIFSPFHHHDVRFWPMGGGGGGEGSLLSRRPIIACVWCWELGGVVVVR